MESLIWQIWLSLH
uniref:Uncharacterized protein n=1 Tax=Rhizophora mucronata TaxID=61149 RepID=A0A2P2PL57_RHIMU